MPHRSSILTLIVTCLLATGANATPYANTAFLYEVEMPAGWATASPADAPSAQFSLAAQETTVQIVAKKKPIALGPDAIVRIKQQDETGIKERSVGHKPWAVNGQEIAGQAATHYGFAYKDARGAVFATRYALLSRPEAGGGAIWFKIQATFPRPRLETANKAFEAFLQGFKIKEPAPTVTVQPTVAPPPTTVPTPVHTTVTTQTSASPPPPPAAGPSSKYSRYVKPMDPARAKAVADSFTAVIKTRTAEEMERARQLGMGGIFKPTTK
ncbi:MAG: hypothetical protein HY815_05595 [Candidatus Riflebacteria bacterium]|nr:hypothetical protein [Candidatus Riflebacteria bacterium]